jgi:NAD(P)H-nitrite reductase large subunit
MLNRVLMKISIGFPEDLSDWPVALQLSSGKMIGCDVVVNAIGVHPNCDMFKGVLDLADEKLGSGIKIDKLMCTSAPGNKLTLIYHLKLFLAFLKSCICQILK